MLVDSSAKPFIEVGYMARRSMVRELINGRRGFCRPSNRGQTFLDPRLRSGEHDLRLVVLAPCLCAVGLRVTNSR